jgi:hypothetical protein
MAGIEAHEHTSPMRTLFTGRLDLAVYVLPFSHVDAFAMGGYLEHPALLRR